MAAALAEAGGSILMSSVTTAITFALNRAATLCVVHAATLCAHAATLCTQVTNAVTFALGAATDLPGLYSFCIYASVGAG